MAIYEYRCSQCGRFDTQQTMGTAAPAMDCPECGRAARRVISAPHLGRMSKPISAAFAAAEKSRDEPNVVTGIPGQRPAPRPHAALARLPRP